MSDPKIPTVSPEITIIRELRAPAHRFQSGPRKILIVGFLRIAVVSNKYACLFD